MTIPAPEPGLVISYSYLWHHEHRIGREEGRKDRPCVIVLVSSRTHDAASVVTVVPVTHRAPDHPAAVEIPPAVKRHLGIDSDRSWVVVDEGNRFVWPGFDLRRIPGGASRYDYGFLPPRFFNEVVRAFDAWHRANKRPLTPR